ncbi:MAG: antitoxin [Nocardioidaceae bacterium]|nr:antitoxin [Nocardioidaceae bacterium]
MTDVLIRNVPDDDLRRIDEKASKLGLSRNDYLRRQIAEDARRSTPERALTMEDFARFADLAADLKDEQVMRDAWS